MAGLSKAQVAAMLDMGDTMIRQGVDHLENPAVNGRTLAVLEREDYVFYGSLSGGWVFTARGYGTYDSLDISRHVNTGHPRMVKPVDRSALIASERAVSVPMWDDVTPVAVDDVLIFKGSVVYVEKIHGDTYTLRGWNRPNVDELTPKTWKMYVDRGVITRVSHNCGICGPGTPASCGSCYPCDRTGRRVLPAGLPEVTSGMKLWNPAKAQVLTVEAVDSDGTTRVGYPDGGHGLLDTDWVRCELGNGNWEVVSTEPALPALSGVCECGKCEPCRLADDDFVCGVDAASTDAEQDSWDRAQATVDAVTSPARDTTGDMADLYDRARSIGYTEDGAARVADCFTNWDSVSDPCPLHPNHSVSQDHQGYAVDECEACQVITISTRDGYMTPAEVAFANTPDAASVRMEDMSRDAAEMILSLILADAELCGYAVTVAPTKRVPRKVKKASKVKSSSKSRRARKG